MAPRAAHRISGGDGSSGESDPGRGLQNPVGGGRQCAGPIRGMSEGVVPAGHAPRIYGLSPQARQKGQRYESLLLALAHRKLEQRLANRLKHWLKEPGLPVLTTLETTDLTCSPSVDGRGIEELAEGEWIHQHENLVLLGRHGTGTIHAAIAMGVQICHRGYWIVISTAGQFVNQMVVAREERTLERLQRCLEHFALLIVAKLGYVRFSQDGAHLVFHVFANRYDRTSLLVTSNLAFAEWIQLFVDGTLTAALLDRLMHDCHIRQFDWESLRLAREL